jgi:hypothetical protein
MSATWATTTTAGVSSTCESAAVFVDWFVTGIAYMSLAVARFVTLEVGKRTGAAFGQRTMVSLTGVVAIVYVAVEAVWPVEPWPSAPKYAAVEPVWAVVAIRSAVIGRIVEVSIGAIWFRAEVDADRNLSFGCAGCRSQRNSTGRHNSSHKRC